MSILLKLATSPWFWLALALASTATATKYAVHEHDALIAYQASVEAVGRAQDAKTKEQTARDIANKEKADAEHTQTVAALNARIAGLRVARTNSSFVPTSTASSVSADRTCFSTSELERAIRSLDQDVQGFVDEGSKAVADLNTAKAWAR